MNDLEKFKPCTGYCQMIGAATALLSIKSSLVIFNSPRWCALTAERELACINKDYERKVFCTEARENDILYGIEKSLRETIKEAIDIEGTPTLLNVITSCSMSLIGDDIKGVCVSETNCNNVITLDAGGFTGTFESGYQLAMIALLKNINSKVREQKSLKVNLLGVCTSYPNWKGNLEELKRLLRLAGIEVNVALGADNTDFAELEKIVEAELNVVLVPELSLNIANYLYESLGQRYIVATMPFGFKDSIKWLNDISSELGVISNLKEIENEIKQLERDIIDESYSMRNFFSDFNLLQVASSLPESLTISIFKAMNNSGVDLLKCNACYCNKKDVIEQTSSNESFPLKQLTEIKGLDGKGYQLLLGTEKERMRFKDFTRTLYLNFSMPMEKIKCENDCYVGVRGWSNFVRNIFSQIKTLEYINKSL